MGVRFPAPSLYQPTGDAGGSPEEDEIYQHEKTQLAKRKALLQESPRLFNARKE